MKIKITADSTADLSDELCKKYDIALIPLSVSLGEKIYQDGINIGEELIFNYVKTTKRLPKTSAVNSETYKDYFNKYLNEGYDAIIHLTISSEMSTCFNNAKQVSSEIGNVYVIDSRTLSSAIGLQAIYASELATTQLYSPKQIVDLVTKRIPNAKASFILDKLEYLYRGGRCNAVSMLGANLLKIKPIIEVSNGNMGMSGKCIGKFEKCVLKYVSIILNKYKTPDYTRIFITHTKIDQSIVESIKIYLKENTNFKEILETTAGATVTSHCGSNTIGILFYNDGDTAL